MDITLLSTRRRWSSGEVTVAMPTFPIIDTHVHLWDPRRLDYGWLKGNVLLDRAYLAEDYQRESRGIETEAMIFLECNANVEQHVQEIEFVEDQARREPRIKGCVPRAPLERGNAIEPLLGSMVARFPRIKGIRRILESDRDDLMLSASFVEGVKLLAKFGLHFEITVNYTQMDVVLEFVQRVPRVPMILDHCGKPGIRGGHIDIFHRHMTELARHPNVMCKLSGLSTEADCEHWTEASLRPFIDVTLAAFGVDRVLYGSDWPVCLQATSLHRWLQEIDRALLGLSESDKRKIYRDNANRFYKLALEPS